MTIQARAIKSFRGLPGESGDGWIEKYEVFEVADQARYDYLEALKLIQDPNIPITNPLPQVEPNVPNDLFSETNPGFMKLSGSNVTLDTKDERDLRDLSANKPDPTTVPGKTYWSIDTDPQGDAIEISDGTQWVVLA